MIRICQFISVNASNNYGDEGDYTVVLVTFESSVCCDIDRHDLYTTHTAVET